MASRVKGGEKQTPNHLTVVVFIVSGFIASCCGLGGAGIPVIFYPFGTDQGDSVAPVNDDGYTSAVPIAIGFPFFNSTRTNLFVNTNGALSFGAGVSSFTPSPFPITSASLIAVYWCDVDTTLNGGRIYYRETTASELLARASRDIQSAFTSQGFYNFQARWLFIATWYNVTFFGGSSQTPTQSFQCVLVTDGVHSFTLFNYADIVWTTGTASGGNAQTGLGGTPAQVGFNYGDAANFYAVPASRTADIVNIDNTTNVGVTGRWAFRIDSARIASDNCLKASERACFAWQTLNANGSCVNVAPSFDCPLLSGPVARSRLWVEFYCAVPNNVTDSAARYEITFVFDGATYDDVPVVTVNASSTTATLHERYLHGRMGKWLGCRVTSFFAGSPTVKSQPVVSRSSYKPGIVTSSPLVVVVENEPRPSTLLVKSTLPIACNTAADSTNPAVSCQIVLEVVTSGTDVAVRQRNHTGNASCSYVIRERDWNAAVGEAFDAARPLEIKARVDQYVTATRLSNIKFRILTATPNKTVNGVTYPNPWAGYVVEPATLVYRFDAASTFAVCSSSGDPRITTFDGLGYSTYATGQFVYARSQDGLPFEVHVRHCPCARSVVSCVCGVAMREEDTILAVDMSTDGTLHTITYNDDGLPPGAGVFVSSSGNSMRIQMPSGNKVIAYVYSWGMNIELHVSRITITQGLCGSIDLNPGNDITPNGADTAVQLEGGMAPAIFISSWSLPRDESLFDGYLAPLNESDSLANDSTPFCRCAENDVSDVCGGPAVADSSAWWEPNEPVVPRVPASAAGHGGSSPTGDNVDYTYRSSSFNRSNSNPNVTAQWPAPNGINQTQAEQGCRQRIVNEAVLGPECYGRHSNSSIAARIVQKCIDDVQLTGDFVWANDKISELRSYCANDIVSRNNSQTNNTQSIIRDSRRSLADFVCDPFDCSGHGTCVNGTCSCQSGYLGAGCSVSASTLPTVDGLLDPAECDVRSRRCGTVSLRTSNVVANAVCRFTVEQYGVVGSVTYTSSTATSVIGTTTCNIPSAVLSLFYPSINLTDLADHVSSFGQLTPGAPFQTLTVAVSNDGTNFSSSNATLGLIDSLCMQCAASGSCQQKAQTCLINGYCFADRQANPLDSCYACQSSASRTAFTNTGSAACLKCKCPTNAIVIITQGKCSCKCKKRGQVYKRGKCRRK